MKVFIAGAGGTIGTRLIPKLVAEGDEVVAMTRSAEKAARLDALGARPVLADALNRAAVVKAVQDAGPDAVVHQLTQLTGVSDYKHFDASFASTNRLRTEGLDYLLDAAITAGAGRFIAQSYGNWNYARTGTGPKRETDALDPDPPANQRQSLAAIRYLEAKVTGAGDLVGIVLRYAGFYGPGTSISEHGDLAELVRKRRLPVIGDGTGVWSFIHIEDAAAATVAAIHTGARGIYNIADDEPVAVAQWLPELARDLGAKPPRKVPTWLGRLAAGEVGVSMMTQIRGASNAKAKRELAWRPAYASYREGFRSGL